MTRRTSWQRVTKLVLAKINHKPVDAAGTFCYNHTPLTNGALPGNGKRYRGRKSIDNRKRHCYKVWLSQHSSLQPNMNRQEKDLRLKYRKVRDSQSGMVLLDRPSKKNFETFS